jgi:uncharacterized protein (TIGR03083 family)
MVEPLDADQLQRPSYCSEWTIAQVLGHLGAQAEVFDLFLDAGLSSQAPPGREAFPPIWNAWNARDPVTKASDALKVDEAKLRRLESLDDQPGRDVRLDVFGLDLDLAGFARIRLGEHALHTWDVAVALDPEATVASDAVDLLVDAISATANRTGKPDGTTRRVDVTTSAPERWFVLETGDQVSLAETEPPAGRPDQAALDLPAEALLRLVYGRLDVAHTPGAAANQVTVDELRPLFPGF